MTLLTEKACLLLLIKILLLFFYQGPRKAPRFSDGDRSGEALVDKNVCSRVYSIHGEFIQTHTLPRWTITVLPALIDEFRPLAAAPRRSRSSELVWALEQYMHARAAEKETEC